MKIRHLKLAGLALTLALLATPVWASPVRQASGDVKDQANARLQIRSEGELPQSFVSGSFLATVVDAVQSPAIEGVTEDLSLGSEWVVIVADIENLSLSSASVSLQDFSLGLGGSSEAQESVGVVVSDVNLREGPGTDTAILGAVPEGTAVTLLGESSNGFLHVEALGQQGWIFADFLSVGDDGQSVASSASADDVASAAASQIVGVESTTPVSIAPAQVERLVMAFPVAAGGQEYSLNLGDTSIPLSPRQRDALSPTGLPPITDALAVGSAVDATVTDGRTLNVELDGKPTDVRLAGIDAPTASQCFRQESSEALRALVAKGVWLQQDGEDFLAWALGEGGGPPTLVNHEMIAKGFAAADIADGSFQFASWFSDADAQAQDMELGLWAECTGVHGTQKPLPTPTPTPTPSAAEVRASYPVLPDVRELAIRPGNLIGDKVAFTGQIFTIQVAPDGLGFTSGDLTPIFSQAVMQVWVIAPDGSQEPVYIAYSGDTTGMFEGTYVTVYGTVRGTQSGTNAMGGTITQPLVEADIVDFA